MHQPIRKPLRQQTIEIPCYCKTWCRGVPFLQGHRVQKILCTKPKYFLFRCCCLLFSFFFLHSFNGMGCFFLSLNTKKKTPTVALFELRPTNHSRSFFLSVVRESSSSSSSSSSRTARLVGRFPFRSTVFGRRWLSAGGSLWWVSERSFTVRIRDDWNCISRRPQATAEAIGLESIANWQQGEGGKHVVLPRRKTFCRISWLFSSRTRSENWKEWGKE